MIFLLFLTIFVKKIAALSTGFSDKLHARFEGNITIPYSDLFAFFRKEFPDLAEKTINWKIYQLKSEGVLSHISRGFYTFRKKSQYHPELSSNLKRIYNKINKELPLVNLCVWDSRLFNEFMIHQLFRYFIVVETEKDATNAVFNKLTGFIKNVFLDPDQELFNRYIVNFDEVVIVKSLISEAPLLEWDKIIIPSVEKLLIDCLIDTDLFAAQQDELDQIFQSVFQKYEVNLNKISRYARRRNQISELEKRINRLNLNL